MKKKSIFTFYLNGQIFAVLVAQLPALVRLESATGIKFTPSGLENDAFGLSYISKRVNRIFTFAECKKTLTNDRQ